MKSSLQRVYAQTLTDPLTKWPPETLSCQPTQPKSPESSRSSTASRTKSMAWSHLYYPFSSVTRFPLKPFFCCPGLRKYEGTDWSTEDPRSFELDYCIDRDVLANICSLPTRSTDCYLMCGYSLSSQNFRSRGEFRHYLIHHAPGIY